MASCVTLTTKGTLVGEGRGWEGAGGALPAGGDYLLLILFKDIAIVLCDFSYDLPKEYMPCIEIKF